VGFEEAMALLAGAKRAEATRHECMGPEPLVSCPKGKTTSPDVLFCDGCWPLRKARAAKLKRVRAGEAR
jgi:hypothetical protein